MSLPILDVAIGLSFIYLLLALVCTSVNELIAGALKLRGKYLELGITRLLNDDLALKEKLYAHPLIKSLTMDAKLKRPAYISGKRFAAALLDLITGPNGSRDNPTDVQAGIAALENPDLKIALKALIPDPGTGTFTAHAAIEEWFNEGMDRVSGWYKRNAQLYVVILATLITIGLNADSLHIARILWINPTLRAQFVDAATQRVDKDRPQEMLPLVEYKDFDKPTESEPVLQSRVGLSDEERDLLAQVMGWDDKSLNKAPLAWFAMIVGWLLSIAAVSLGAPFWFDTLKRFVNIRNSGRSPVEARDKTA